MQLKKERVKMLQTPPFQVLCFLRREIYAVSKRPVWQKIRRGWGNEESGPRNGLRPFSVDSPNPPESPGHLETVEEMSAKNEMMLLFCSRWLPRSREKSLMISAPCPADANGSQSTCTSQRAGTWQTHGKKEVGVVQCSMRWAFPINKIVVVPQWTTPINPQ